MDLLSLLPSMPLRISPQPVQFQQLQDDRVQEDEQKRLVSIALIPFDETIDQSGILFLGLNANAHFEAHALESVGLPLQRILYQESSRITLGDRSFDLTIENEVWDFIQTLGFQGAQATALVDAVWGLDFAIRDEVARLIQVWSVAELKDGDIPTRLVLSGHSGGRFFWGLGSRPQEFSGNLELRDLRRITRLMPKAVDRVRSIFLAGCNTGWEDNLRQMAALFPKAHSLTGYTNSAPLANEEAPAEILHWAQWTFLDEDSLRPFAPNMAVFHPSSGFYQQQKSAGQRPENLVALDEDPEWRQAKRNQLFKDDLSEITDPYKAEVLRGVLETSLRFMESLRSGHLIAENQISENQISENSFAENPFASDTEILSQLQASILEILADPDLPDRYRQALENLRAKLGQ